MLGGVALLAPAGGPVDVGLYPGVFEADGLDRPALCDAACGNAALVHELQGGAGGGGVAYPVHGLGSRDLDGAKLVAGRDAYCAQQCDLQASNVHGAALFIQGVLRTLMAPQVGVHSMVLRTQLWMAWSSAEVALKLRALPLLPPLPRLRRGALRGP